MRSQSATKQHGFLTHNPSLIITNSDLPSTSSPNVNLSVFNCSLVWKRLLLKYWVNFVLGLIQQHDTICHDTDFFPPLAKSLGHFMESNIAKRASHKESFKNRFKKQRAIQHMHYPCGDGLANVTWNWINLAHNFFLFFPFLGGFFLGFFFCLVDWLGFFGYFYLWQHDHRKH